MFDVSLINIVSWIVFGFTIGVLVHEIRPVTNHRHIYKDIILAMLGSIVGGLTIIFFYGYPFLGLLVTSIVSGICFAAVYVIFQKYIQDVHPKIPLHKPNSNNARYYTLPLGQKH